MLQVVRVPYVNSSSCAEIYRDQSSEHEHFRNFMVTNNHFCAGSE